MRNRSLASPLLALLVALSTPVLAQNVLPNAEFNTGIAPWISEFAAERWDGVDSRGCPGSGAFESDCSFVDTISNGECIVYSAPAAYVAYNLAASADVPGMEDHGFYVTMYSDTGCVTPNGFPMFVGVQNAQIGATFSTFEFQQGLAAGTQSVRVSFTLGEMNCEPGMLLFLDSPYYGEMPRILTHDFENGDVCPFTAF